MITRSCDDALVIHRSATITTCHILLRPCVSLPAFAAVARRPRRATTHVAVPAPVLPPRHLRLNLPLSTAPTAPPVAPAADATEPTPIISQPPAGGSPAFVPAARSAAAAPTSPVSIRARLATAPTAASPVRSPARRAAASLASPARATQPELVHPHQQQPQRPHGLGPRSPLSKPRSPALSRTASGLLRTSPALALLPQLEGEPPALSPHAAEVAAAAAHAGGGAATRGMGGPPAWMAAPAAAARPSASTRPSAAAPAAAAHGAGAFSQPEQQQRQHHQARASAAPATAAGAQGSNIAPDATAAAPASQQHQPKSAPVQQPHLVSPVRLSAVLSALRKGGRTAHARTTTTAGGAASTAAAAAGAAARAGARQQRRETWHTTAQAAHVPGASNDARPGPIPARASMPARTQPQAPAAYVSASPVAATPEPQLGGSSGQGTAVMPAPPPSAMAATPVLTPAWAALSPCPTTPPPSIPGACTPLPVFPPLLDTPSVGVPRGVDAHGAEYDGGERRREHGWEGEGEEAEVGSMGLFARELDLQGAQGEEEEAGGFASPILFKPLAEASSSSHTPAAARALPNGAETVVEEVGNGGDEGAGAVPAQPLQMREPVGPAAQAVPPRTSSSSSSSNQGSWAESPTASPRDLPACRQGSPRQLAAGSPGTQPGSPPSSLPQSHGGSPQSVALSSPSAGFWCYPPHPHRHTRPASAASSAAFPAGAAPVVNRASVSHHLLGLQQAVAYTGHAAAASSALQLQGVGATQQDSLTTLATPGAHNVTPSVGGVTGITGDDAAGPPSFEVRVPPPFHAVWQNPMYGWESASLAGEPLQPPGPDADVYGATGQVAALLPAPPAATGTHTVQPLIGHVTSSLAAATPARRTSAGTASEVAAAGAGARGEPQEHEEADLQHGVRRWSLPAALQPRSSTGTATSLSATTDLALRPSTSTTTITTTSSSSQPDSYLRGSLDHQLMVQHDSPSAAAAVGMVAGSSSHQRVDASSAASARALLGGILALQEACSPRGSSGSSAGRRTTHDTAAGAVVEGGGGPHAARCTSSLDGSISAADAGSPAYVHSSAGSSLAEARSGALAFSSKVLLRSSSTVHAAAAAPEPVAMGRALYAAAVVGAVSSWAQGHASVLEQGHNEPGQRAVQLATAAHLHAADAGAVAGVNAHMDYHISSRVSHAAVAARGGVGRWDAQAGASLASESLPGTAVRQWQQVQQARTSGVSRVPVPRITSTLFEEDDDASAPRPTGSSQQGGITTSSASSGSSFQGFAAPTHSTSSPSKYANPGAMRAASSAAARVAALVAARQAARAAPPPAALAGLPRPISSPGRAGAGLVGGSWSQDHYGQLMRSLSRPAALLPGKPGNSVAGPGVAASMAPAAADSGVAVGVGAPAAPMRTQIKGTVGLGQGFMDGTGAAGGGGGVQGAASSSQLMQRLKALNAATQAALAGVRVSSEGGA